MSRKFNPGFKGTCSERAPLRLPARRYLRLKCESVDPCPVGAPDRSNIPRPKKLPSAQFSKQQESGLRRSRAKRTAYHSRAPDHSVLERRLVWAAYRVLKEN